jgi:hypothetical protein
MEHLSTIEAKAELPSNAKLRVETFGRRTGLGPEVPIV